MSNNQNSIKNIIRKYFIKGDSDLKELKEKKIEYTGYSPLKYKQKEIDITDSSKTPAMTRAMKALQISNPFKGI